MNQKDQNNIPVEETDKSAISVDMPNTEPIDPNTIIANENHDLSPEIEVEELKTEKKIKQTDDKDDESSEFDFGAVSDGQKHWYVINTYSGYEDNVAQALHQRIDSMDMNDRIFDVIVPKEKKVEIKNGKKKIVEKKIFPGYVLVQMVVDEDSWYVVRNTPSVTGFIGFGNKPSPLSEDEIKNIQKRMGIDEPEFKIDYEIGESVKIVDGPFKDFDGVISEIDKVRGKIKVLVSMFGRETPVELDALQIQRI
jgi:transcriptional antiterminator NusG